MDALFPRMLQDYIERRVDACLAPRAARFAAINNRAAMARHVAAVRADMQQIYNLPEEKTPLNARITGEIKTGSYNIQKVLYESRLRFFVTANLYVPRGAGPFPCVLVLCEHADIGKAAPRYQQLCAGLAAQGFLTLIIDPIGQGERSQYLEYKQQITRCVVEHILAGNQQYLVGGFFGAWRAWDAVRGLDLLLALPQANPAVAGVTGHSGGGTMSAVMLALDERLTMGAPGCFITTYRRNLHNELAADSEQYPPGIIGRGYELYDHLTAAAPRPVLILAKENDYFDLRGAREAYRHLRRVYSLLGKSANIRLMVEKGGHGYGPEMGAAMAAFFCRQAGITPARNMPAGRVV